MSERLRVLIVDDNPGRSAILSEALRENDYDVIAQIDDHHDILDVVRETGPDVVIIDMDAPGRDTLESMQVLSREQPKPIVMFAKQSDSETIERAVKAGVSAYIVDGLSSARLKPIMDVAIARFREFHSLKQELEKTKSSLEERKLIDRAKGVIMKQRNCSEDEAYSALRKLAMDTNQKIAAVAKNVITYAELFK